MSFTLSADLLRIANTCVSTEETRYYLNGVCIQRAPTGGALLITTDGHRLICVHDETATGDIPDGAIISIHKAQVSTFKTGKEGRKDNTPRRVSITLGASASAPVSAKFNEGHRDVCEIYLSQIDGSFPYWRRVVPRIEPDAKQETGCFNAAYIADFAEVAAAFAAMKQARVAPMTMACQSVSAPALVRWGDAPAFGVLMPIKGDDGAEQLPAWLNAKPQSAAA